MSGTPEQPIERRDALRKDLAELRATMEQHITEEFPVVKQLTGQIAEIRTEQRTVLKELAAEQAKVLGAVKEDQAIVRFKLDANTAITQEVRDILTTFKTLGAFAKWFGYIVAALAGAWAAIKGFRG